LGCFAFVFFTAFDFNQKFSWFPKGGLLFFLGFTVLLAATAGICLTGETRFSLPLGIRIMLFVFACLFFYLLLSALFFSLPFHDTYLESKENRVVDRGLYALCRHPGVLFFFMMYVCIWLFSGSLLTFWAMIVWTAMDVLHVWVQDRWFFPHTISGYTQYQKTTPFLIPTPDSFKNCLQSAGGRGRRI
jgi:protein-S-isoprenylcysteine O-methyltransferase Ste14